MCTCIFICRTANGNVVSLKYLWLASLPFVNDGKWFYLNFLFYTALVQENASMIIACINMCLKCSSLLDHTIPFILFLSVCTVPQKNLILNFVFLIPNFYWTQSSCADDWPNLFSPTFHSISVMSKVLWYYPYALNTNTSIVHDGDHNN